MAGSRNNAAWECAAESAVVDIESLTWAGDGAAQWNGRILRVPGTLPGERAAVRVLARGKARHGQLRDVLVPSPDRRQPDCGQAAVCRGCQLRHVAYSAQLRMKRARVAEIIQRLAGVPAALVAPTVPHPQPDCYRMRATARVIGGHQQLTLGMPGVFDSNQPADLTRCPAQTPQTRDLLTAARTALQQCQEDGRRAEPLWISVHSADDGPGRIIVSCITPQLFPARLFSTLVHDNLPGTSIFLARCPASGAAVAADIPSVVTGREQIELRIAGLPLRASAAAWTPLSSAGAEALIRLIHDGLTPPAGLRILEVGCGIGTISLALARAAQSVHGIDSRWSAARDAQANACSNRLSNATFQMAKAPAIFRRLVRSPGSFSAAIFHAIRKPYGAEAFALLPRLGITRLACVAPVPASLARDLADLIRLGWKVERIVPIDLIAQTAHIMSVAFLAMEHTGPLRPNR